MEEGRAVRHPTSGQRRDKVRIGVQTRTGYLERIDRTYLERRYVYEPGSERKQKGGSHSHMGRIPPSTTWKEQFMKIFIYMYFMLSSEKLVIKKKKITNIYFVFNFFTSFDHRVKWSIEMSIL
jgi:hypothetical protein